MQLVAWRTFVLAVLLLVASPLIFTGRAQDAAKYSDVPENHWALPSIDRVSRAGLVEGLSDGSYAGNRAVTRYEAAVTIARFFARWSYGPGATASDYPDVVPGHWAYEAVRFLDGWGVIEGLPDGNFAGNQPMTRYTYAVFMARIVVTDIDTGVDFWTALRRHNETGVATFFPDVPPQHWACPAVNWLAIAGLSEGFADGLYRGNRAMTRYELAAALARLLR